MNNIIKNESLEQNDGLNNKESFLNLNLKKDTDNSDKIKKNRFISKKRNKSNDKKIINNPDISHFNSQSHFIYDIDEGKKYLLKTKNKNSLKLSNTELNLLYSLVDEIKLIQNIHKGIEIININKNILNKLNSFYPETIPDDPLTNFIKKKFNEVTNINNITCRKLSTEFYQEIGIKISKSTVNNVIRKKLGYRYLKTTIKSKKIISEPNLLISLCFLKKIERCIRLNIRLLFLDESSILSTNNNYKIWRKPKEEIYFDLPKKEKVNLLMTVSDDDVIYYSFIKENTNEKIFIKYMEDLEKVIKLKNIGPYAIIMDNLSVHKTKALIKFYEEKKINVIFNSPYLSNFNAIEYAFRRLKKKIYSKIYNCIEDIISKSSTFIESSDFKSCLKFNFKETLQNYITFSEKYKYLNLNNIISE